MSKNSNPTIEDVAREAGVSTATVSRCINNPEQVSKNTRLKVEKVVYELGYSPNFGAQALASKKTNTIGAVIPTMENAIFARGIQAFQEELQAANITLLVASSSYDQQIEKQQIRNLVARGADGLLLIGHQRDPEVYSYLKRREIPFVLSWVYEEHSEYISVGFDNYAPMRELTRLAIKNGHKAFGMIAASIKDNDRARARVDGVKDELKSYFASDDHLQLIETQYGIKNGAVAFEQLMSTNVRPTIIFCGNDVLAVGAISAAHRLGLEIPKDVSITGFDDIEIATISKPALTTVHVPHREMGKRAAKHLIEMINKNTVQSLKLETHLEWRESTTYLPE